MDGAIDIRLIVTLGGILFSVAGAAAVGKMQIKVIQDTLSDIEARLRKIDIRIDQLENAESVIKQRVDIIAKMNSPENLRRDHIAMATLTASVEQLRKEMDHQLAIHNGRHIPVASERAGT